MASIQQAFSPTQEKHIQYGLGVLSCSRTELVTLYYVWWQIGLYLEIPRGWRCCVLVSSVLIICVIASCLYVVDPPVIALSHQMRGLWDKCCAGHTNPATWLPHCTIEINKLCLAYWCNTWLTTFPLMWGREDLADRHISLNSNVFMYRLFSWEFQCPQTDRELRWFPFPLLEAPNVTVIDGAKDWIISLLQHLYSESSTLRRSAHLLLWLEIFTYCLYLVCNLLPTSTVEFPFWEERMVWHKLLQPLEPYVSEKTLLSG